MTGSFALRLGGIALALMVAGCSGPPWVTAQSPDAVVLLWYPQQTPVFVSRRAAQAHCAAFGKRAVLVADEEAPATQRAQYDCR